MAKWADYCISAVRYNDEHTHIVKVKACEDKGETLGDTTEWARIDVVNAIDRGKSFVTIYKSNDSKYKKGEDVRIITVNNVKYIRTDANQKAADNLGNLPEF
jgi:hypothetical protein